MHKVCLIVIVLLVGQGTHGSTLGVPPSLREMWAELMEGTSTTAGVCGKGCYVEIAGTTHYFEYQYFDKTNPCKEYICDTASGNVVTQIITCAENQPCESQTQKVFFPGKCCPQCRGVDVDVPRVTEWSEWTKCSETCGLGQRARSRTCIVPENVPNVGDCSGVTLLEFGTCDLTPCPVDCEWEYGRCERCSATCGSGTKLCPPVITQKPQHGGRECPDFVRNGESQLLECTDLGPCPPVDCEWEYGRCGKCSASCGSGTRQCAPIITQEPQHGGRDCPGFVRRRQSQLLECTDLEPCQPVDCEWEYGACDSCSVTCGNGNHFCQPIITQQPQHGGRECPDFVRNGHSQLLECTHPKPCPVDCEWEYRDCSSCSRSCGSATKTCTPFVTRAAANGGEECPVIEPVEVECTELPECPCREGYHECTRIITVDKKKTTIKACLRDTVDTNCECLLESRSEDYDGDFIRNDCDNCPKVVNPGQEDRDCKLMGAREQDLDGPNLKEIAAAIMEKLVEMYYNK